MLGLALCLATLPEPMVAAYFDTSGVIGTDSFLKKQLSQNSVLMNETFNNQMQIYSHSCNFAQIDICSDKKVVQISLTYNEIHYNAILKGICNEVNAEETSGFVGVYEGSLIPVRNGDFISEQSANIPIIADITFTNTEMFAILTLGYVTSTEKPVILFLGDFTESIAQVSTIHAERSLAEVKVRNSETEMITPMSVDGTCKYQESEAAYAGNYMVGVLSIFHADELKNQGNMSTYAKVNTRTYDMEKYIEEDIGLNAISVYADRFDVSICGNHNSFHAVTNSYLPQDGSTSETINIPVYLGSVIGLQLIPFELEMTSTTVSTSKYSSTSPHPNNKITWSISKLTGWNSDTFDGGYGTEKGMTVASTFTYEDNVTSDISQSMSATAVIRFQYVTMVAGKLVTHHLSSETMSLTSNITICP